MLLNTVPKQSNKGTGDDSKEHKKSGKVVGK